MKARAGQTDFVSGSDKGSHERRLPTAKTGGSTEGTLRAARRRKNAAVGGSKNCRNSSSQLAAGFLLWDGVLSRVGFWGGIKKIIKRGALSHAICGYAYIDEGPGPFPERDASKHE